MLFRNLKVVTYLCVLFLASCATIPSYDKMKSDVATFNLPKLPERDKAIVYVIRPENTGKFIKFNVFLDDKEAQSEMGFTRGMQYIYFNVTPGIHKILSKAENWAEEEINVKAGEIIFLRQVPSMGFVMARNSIVNVNEVEGKYYVKTLELGTIMKTNK